MDLAQRIQGPMGHPGNSSRRRAMSEEIDRHVLRKCPEKLDPTDLAAFVLLSKFVLRE